MDDRGRSAQARQAPGGPRGASGRQPCVFQSVAFRDLRNDENQTEICRPARSANFVYGRFGLAVGAVFYTGSLFPFGLKSANIYPADHNGCDGTCFCRPRRIADAGWYDKISANQETKP